MKTKRITTKTSLRNIPFASSARRAIIGLLFRPSFLSSAMRRASLRAFRFFESRTILTRNESQRTLLIFLYEFLRADPILDGFLTPYDRNWYENDRGAGQTCSRALGSGRSGRAALLCKID
jgi:hypothetical protein